MTTSTIIKGAAAILLALSPIAAGAQRLNETVNVDAKYKPDIIRLNRVGALPARVAFDLKESPLPYSSKSVVTNFNPALYELPATGWMASRTPSRYPGYFGLGMGSWLNADASLGYRFINTDNTSLGFSFQHNSTTLFKPESFEEIPKVGRKRYDDVLAVSGSNLFDGLGRLDAQLRYHVGYFNYASWAHGAAEDDAVAPSQTLNDLFARVGWQSLENASGLNWNAALSARYFGYRALYIPQEDRSYTPFRGLRETRIRLDGGVYMNWDAGSAVGLNADINAMLYSQPEFEPGVKTLDNYGIVSLTPFYRFQRGLLNIRLGARLDLSMNAGPDADRYSFFHIAPDVALDWQSGPAGLYLRIGGGSRLATLAGFSQLDPYQTPMLATTRPMYEPINARLGFNFGPFSGFTAGFSVAYKRVNNVPLRGWYSALRYHELFGMPSLFPMAEQPLDMDIKGISAALNLKYSLGNVFTVGLEGSYQPQNKDDGYFNGFDRARWIFNGAIEVAPIKPLHICLDYNYRGVRTIYGPETAGSGDILVNDDRIFGLRLKDISYLNLQAKYDVTSRFNVFVQANNLLNRKDALLPAQGQQGINFLAGFGVIF